MYLSSNHINTNLSYCTENSTDFKNGRF
ncbi:MAG: hypothetical protein ACI9LN_003037, partial [Saprospiraceae bacterium]